MLHLLGRHVPKVEHCPCCPFHNPPKTRKRRNGGGTVFFKRTAKLWCAAVSIPSGKRLVACAKTREKAELELVRLQAIRARLVAAAA